MRRYIINGLKSLNWTAIIMPGVVLSLELLIKHIMKKNEKHYRYSESSYKRLT